MFPLHDGKAMFIVFDGYLLKIIEGARVNDNAVDFVLLHTDCTVVLNNFMALLPHAKSTDPRSLNGSNLSRFLSN